MLTGIALVLISSSAALADGRAEAANSRAINRLLSGSGVHYLSDPQLDTGHFTIDSAFAVGTSASYTLELPATDDSATLSVLFPEDSQGAALPGVTVTVQSNAAGDGIIVSDMFVMWSMMAQNNFAGDGDAFAGARASVEGQALNTLLRPLGVEVDWEISTDNRNLYFDQAMTFRMQASVPQQLAFAVSVDSLPDFSIRTARGGTITLSSQLYYGKTGALTGWRLYFPGGTGETDAAALPGVTVTLTPDGGAQTDTSLGDFVVVKQWD